LGHEVTSGVTYFVRAVTYTRKIYIKLTREFRKRGQFTENFVPTG
jgi:hypothetical protein